MLCVSTLVQYTAVPFQVSEGWGLLISAGFFQQKCDGVVHKIWKKLLGFFLGRLSPMAVILENSGLFLFKFLENEIKLGLGERLNKNDSYGCMPLKSCIFVSDNCKLKKIYWL